MDQCKNCTSRGDMELCLNTPCSQHESWMVKQQRVEIFNLRLAITDIIAGDPHGGTYSGSQCVDIARAALDKTK